MVSDSYYEWFTNGKKKQPYFTHFQDHRPFGIAGLLERWNGPDQTVQTSTIITTSAVDRMGWLHERMPVIVPPEMYSTWLSGQVGKEILTGYTGDDLITIPVGTEVRNVRNDSPTLIEPLGSLL